MNTIQSAVNKDPKKVPEDEKTGWLTPFHSILDDLDAEELDYLENAYRAVHPVPPWMPMPISTENFLAFGVSSTPTLVLVDRDNVVRLYNPGDESSQMLSGHGESLCPQRSRS